MEHKGLYIVNSSIEEGRISEMNKWWLQSELRELVLRSNSLKRKKKGKPPNSQQHQENGRCKNSTDDPLELDLYSKSPHIPPYLNNNTDL